MFFCVAPARSEVFPWLYQGVVEGVGNSPSEEEVRQALEQVITRLTGLRQPQEHEKLAGMFAQSYQMVQEYSFLPRTASGALRFRIGFHRSNLEEWLRKARLPIWNEWRPRLLLFVVSADGASLTRILGNGGGESWGAADYRQLIDRMHYRRGLLLTLPSHSYADRQIAVRYVLPGNYWRAVRDLRKLYAVDGVILLHVERTGVAERSTGRYFFSEEIEGQLSSPKTHQIDQLLEDTLHRIGDYYWARNARHERPTKALRLIVEGLQSYSALEHVSELLASLLPEGHGLKISRLGENRAEFDFSVQQSVLELRSILSRQQEFELLKQQAAPGFVQNLFVQYIAPVAEQPADAEGGVGP